MTVILGFNAFHADSAACLVVDGQLVGAVAEERLGERQKHCPAFPAHAIRRLLADAGLRLRDVTHVALARDPTANRAAKLAYVARHPLKATGGRRRASAPQSAHPEHLGAVGRGLRRGPGAGPF